MKGCNDTITLEDVKRMQKALDDANVPMPHYFFSTDGKRYKFKRIPAERKLEDSLAVAPFEICEEVAYDEEQ